MGSRSLTPPPRPEPRARPGTGAISAPTRLPAGPATAGGYPVISEARALAVLQDNATGEPPPPVRLKVTRVRLGASVFLTDRGNRARPAWQFSFAGVRGPIAVLAVDPARIFWPAGLAPQSSAGLAQLGRDGRTVTVHFAGVAAGTGPCTADSFLRQLTVVLPSPLGPRVLVDATSRQPYSVTGTGP